MKIGVFESLWGCSRWNFACILTLKRIFQPSDVATVYGEYVKTINQVAELRLEQQKMVRGPQQALLFGTTDTGHGVAELAPCAHPNLDKDEGLSVQHDDIDFSCVAGVVALNGFEPVATEVNSGADFSPRAFVFRDDASESTNPAH